MTSPAPPENCTRWRKREKRGKEGQEEMFKSDRERTNCSSWGLARFQEKKRDSERERERGGEASEAERFSSPSLTDPARLQ